MLYEDEILEESKFSGPRKQAAALWENATKAVGLSRGFIVAYCGVNFQCFFKKCFPFGNKFTVCAKKYAIRAENDTLCALKSGVPAIRFSDIL